MRYYSDLTRKLYESEKDLVEAENKQKEVELAEKRKKEELAENRKIRAKEVDQLMKDAIAAQKAYKKALAAFNKDFGPFHFTWTGDSSILDLFDWF